MFSRLDDPVRVEVGTGDDLRSFTVHGAFLTFRSLFFRKALSGAWKEAKERLIKLPEDDSDTFELYLQVVYGLPMSIEPNPLFDEYPGRSEQEALAKLYVFAEKVQDVRAKNTIMKAFLKSVWKVRSDGLCYVPARGSIHVIYEGSTPGSSMRRLLVDIYAYGITHEELSHEGVKGKAAVVLVGWKSDEARTAFRQTKTFEECVGLLKGEAKAIDTLHVMLNKPVQ